MIKTKLKEISWEFRTQLDLDSFGQLFQMRADDPSIKIPRGLDHYFLESQEPAEAKLAAFVKNYNREEKQRLLLQVGEARAEIRDFAAKPTAANKKKIEVRERKILKIEAKLALELGEPDIHDDRVYPAWYAPVVAEGKAGRKLVPMRYRVRNLDGSEVPSQYNVFNARRDSLLSARTWKPLFGRTHCIFPFVRFYEWVERGDQKKEIYFSPDHRNGMWAASLYSVAKGPFPLLSFAMVTDEPPPEVASAGHDRCPIFLAEDKIGDWLAPQNLAPDRLLGLLDSIEKPHYSHGLAA